MGGIGPRGGPPGRPCACLGIAAWSPDGRRLAVRTWNGLYVMDADGTHVVAIAGTDGGTFGDGRPAWQTPRRKGTR